MYKLMKLFAEQGNTSFTSLEQTKEQIKALNKEGVFNETEREENGYITKSVEFISTDGSVKIKQSFTEKKLDEKQIEINSYAQKIAELDYKKEIAINNEDYIEAASLKKEQDFLTDKIKQINGNVK